VTGELDLATAPRLEQALEPVDAAQRLVLDLAGCTFVDSSAIRVLAARAQAASQAGGGVAVVVTESGVRRALEIAAIDTVLDLHESRDAALEAL
jgi:anti-sigma B factor antagonist